jgi:hypothetical protein
VDLAGAVVTTISNTDSAQVILWADRIRPHLVAAVENIIAAGRGLHTAKEDLAHGEFLDLVKSLGLRPRTAQKFMAIARHELIANAPPGTHLPASWTTLYELSRVPDALLEQALADGQVSRDMSRKDAVQLAARLQTEEMSEQRARALTTKLRQAQWEMGAVAAGVVSAGGDLECCSAMLEEVEPAVWDRFGYDGPVAWLKDCMGLFQLFPKPDFSRSWDEQQEEGS